MVQLGLAGLLRGAFRCSLASAGDAQHALSFLPGIFPLVIATGAGAGSRVALGTAVFGGMLAATVVGILLIPVTYFVVQSLREKVNSFLGGKPEHPEPSIAE